MADNIFTYENVKNNKEIGDQWRNYVLQKFKDRPSWLLLTQSLGDNNTLQIDKLTPEFFNTINKIYGAPTSYKDGYIDTTPLRPPLMQKSAQQTPDNNNDKTGNAVARGDAQGSNNGSGGAQGAQAGNGTYASADVAKGGTKTIGYDPNPGNISLAYVMRNAPEQERRTALINKWNRENGRESVPYVPGTEIPAGSLNRSSSTYASPGIGNGGMYATGEGIKDANGNVLTNPGGDWEYQYALKDPQYGLGMMGKMSDAQKKYLQAVSDDMGYKYNFKGANRFV